jgi:tellurite methyltransferase
MSDLRAQFGDIDIYLFDQLLRGRITPGMRIVDAGCGAGRNLVYLLQQRYDVYGVDADPVAIETVRRLAARLAPDIPPENFQVQTLEHMAFPDHFADVVVTNAVLHFARDDEQFGAMLRSCWRVLKPGGMLFARLASTIGMEGRFASNVGRWQRMPDGSERYLVDEVLLMHFTRELGGELLDPLKTTVVQNQRCMTTWVMRKVA